MLHAVFDRLTQRITEETRRLYGERLVSLVLFGSVARGTMGPDSDIDLLVVAEPLPEGRMARVREFDRVELALADDLAQASHDGVRARLSPVFKTPEEVGHGSPLFLDMTLEARILHDRDSFFAGYLDGLRGRMQALGSQRRQLGGGYYWVLKPDWKPGEEIRL
jgi:predicted nucleotidyltransferase